MTCFSLQIFYSQQNSLSNNINSYLEVQIAILNSNSSLNHRPMSETSDSLFVEHYFIERF